MQKFCRYSRILCHASSFSLQNPLRLYFGLPCCRQTEMWSKTGEVHIFRYVARIIRTVSKHPPQLFTTTVRLLLLQLRLPLRRVGTPCRVEWRQLLSQLALPLCLWCVVFVPLRGAEHKLPTNDVIFISEPTSVDSSVVAR